MRACWRRFREIWLACRCDCLQRLASVACHGVGCCCRRLLTAGPQSLCEEGWHRRRVPGYVKVSLVHQS